MNYHKKWPLLLFGQFSLEEVGKIPFEPVSLGGWKFREFSKKLHFKLSEAVKAR